MKIGKAIIAIIVELIIVLLGSAIAHGQDDTAVENQILPVSGYQMLTQLDDNNELVFWAQDEGGGCVGVLGPTPNDICFDRTTLDRITVTKTIDTPPGFVSYSLIIYRKGDLGQSLGDLKVELSLTSLGRTFKAFVSEIANLLEARDIHCHIVINTKQGSANMSCWMEI